MPGVAVGVMHADEVNTAGFGITHIDHPLAITPDTLFQIGSITKTFVGTAVMRLVEAGKLNLDTPVRTYVPELTLQDPMVWISHTKAICSSSYALTQDASYIYVRAGG